jgi:hypothetical protein
LFVGERGHVLLEKIHQAPVSLQEGEELHGFHLCVAATVG